jgi:Cu+-exporting ATPase
LERIEELEKKTESKIICYHCGEECIDNSFHINEKIFCCNGCRTVYEILDDSGLCNYYSLEETPGKTQKHQLVKNYDYLDDPELINRLIDFSDGKTVRVTLDIPHMHCSSCIWILENLHKLNHGIISSKVNFLQKKIFVIFSVRDTSLKDIIRLLDSIGYEPTLNLDERKESTSKSELKNLYYKIGIAGFCFGNIMLLSFPEYLSINSEEHERLKSIFAYLNIILSLPVFFYSAQDYFISSWKGLKKKIINIDVPLALGILVLFIRSLVEIIFFGGAGYLDSLAGLVFFLLIGKVFQTKTYDTLNFERDYKSYFPISVTINTVNGETTIPIEKLKVGQRIIVRNNELIPADSVLIKGSGNIDYSFVTGESTPDIKNNGDIIFAGGKQIGGVIELETIKEVSQSYLTQLWNNNSLDKDHNSKIVGFANSISKYFTFAIISIAVIGGIIWYPDLLMSFNVFTAVLIVACPCAFALSTPFTLGNAMRIFGKNNFYIKKTNVLEELAAINTIVFDKTGTITETGKSLTSFIGDELTELEEGIIKSTVRNSSHPLSLAIYHSIHQNKNYVPDLFLEEAGKGLSAKFGENSIKIGSSDFVGISDKIENPHTHVFVSINNQVKGFFQINNKYRDGLKEIINELNTKYQIHLLSGDNSNELEKLKGIFSDNNQIYFRQSPFDKLKFINNIRNKGKKVLMIGDGLNDAGALNEADVGISISDNTNNFSPACDGILDSKNFNKLSRFIEFSRISKKIIIASFVFSTIYNLIGLFFALSGVLTPLIAAVLMPVSSISVVVFTTVLTNYFGYKKGFIK